MAAKTVYIASVPTSKRVADRLAFELDMRGNKVLQSPTDARKPSDSYVMRIEQADAFVCVIGAESLDQALFRQEIDRALWLHKPMLFVFHEHFQLTHSHKSALKPLLARFDHIFVNAAKEPALENTVAQITNWLKNPSNKLPAQQRHPDYEFEPCSVGTKYHIFLSYSRKDKEFVMRLHHDLTQQGFKVWIDQYELELGTPDWEIEIVQAINHSGCVVAVMTPDAANSKWVARELAKSDDLDRTIFPILARGDAGHAIPLRLSTHQRVDATKNYNEGLHRLVGALRRHLAASPV